MKNRHADAAALEARAILGALGIKLGADFHTLPRSKVDGLLVEADRARYRRPRGANGSRARYFHDMLQRRATHGG